MMVFGVERVVGKNVIPNWSSEEHLVALHISYDFIQLITLLGNWNKKKIHRI